MSFKRVKVVMLSTKEKSNLSMDNYGKLYFGNYPKDTPLNQHLYFLSDEEIKEGDLRLDEKTGKTWRINNEHTFNHPSGYKMLKIIATTDKSLSKTIKSSYVQFGDNVEETRIEFLPQPSQSFLEKFVEEYNHGNVITEVMVEYDYRVKSGTIDEHKKGLAGYEYFELKINPKDNTITIRKIKDSWNREEVVELMAKAFYTDCRVWRNKYQDWEEVDFDEWIEENL